MICKKTLGGGGFEKETLERNIEKVRQGVTYKEAASKSPSGCMSLWDG